MFEDFDFLPGTLHPYLRILIYVLVLLHILALITYFVLCFREQSRGQKYNQYIEMPELFQNPKQKKNWSKKRDFV